MERDFIKSLLLPIADTAAARGLADDAAVWAPPLGREIVLTHDVMTCGVHYLAADPPSDIAWKLLAVNLSDLAAMGARPAGVLLGLALSPAEDAAWREAFVAGLGRALTQFGVSLWGGDTTRGVAAAVLGLTAIGHVVPGTALSRSGAAVGDDVWVSGCIGDAGLGLAMARGEMAVDKPLLNRFRRPVPRLALGAGLVGLATACMDVSDGLLIDADRMGQASGVRIDVVLADVPVLPLAVDRLTAVTAGDDYELLFTAPQGRAGDVQVAAQAARTPVTRIGTVAPGLGVRALGPAEVDVTPARLGWEH